jgi:hypothetical protein
MTDTAQLRAPETKSRKITEADLCAAFIAAVVKEQAWTAYPETAGFDILLVRNADGAQLGLEAKLKLNAKVISQALPSYLQYSYGMDGPDYRGVLIPRDTSADLAPLCRALGIGVIAARVQPDPAYVRTQAFWPPLPVRDKDHYGDQHWHEWGPVRRCKLPDYVPDVGAGNPSPLKLTEWKIRAIKLAVILEERPVTRADFKALSLNPQRWLDPWTKWLVKTDDGYIPGPGMPKLKFEHPTNYEQIKADKAKWMPAAAPKQGVML